MLGSNEIGIKALVMRTNWQSCLDLKLSPACAWTSAARTRVLAGAVSLQSLLLPTALGV